MIEEEKNASEKSIEKSREHFPEKKEIDSNKAGSPDKNQDVKPSNESAKNSK